MTMIESAQAPRLEPRWPVMLTIVAVLLLLALLPERVRLLPTWLPCVVVIVVFAPMAAVRLNAGKARWLRVDRTIMLLFFVFMGAVSIEPASGGELEQKSRKGAKALL
jgi:hypothetical protein